MRIDYFLNKISLTKTRVIAKKACDKSLVSINDKIAKASSRIEVGDRIYVELYGYKKVIDVVLLPKGNVRKKDVANYYKLVKNIPFD